MKLRSTAAAIGLSAMLILPTAGCVTNPDGTVMLNPSARAKLETASKWAHRFSAGVHLTIVGITTTCDGKTSKFCAVAMPLVALADGALALYDEGLKTADAALANSGTPEEQLSAAAAGLIKLEDDVEGFLSEIKVQKSMLEPDSPAVTWPQAAETPPAFSANPLPNG